MEPFDDPDIPPARRADGHTLKAASDLRSFVTSQPSEVFYERELQVRFEKQYFHWVTGRALRHLASEAQIASVVERRGPQTLRFFHARGLRYVRRPIKTKADLVARMTALGRALGAQGEMLAENLLLRASLLPRSTNSNTWRNRTWLRTDHDMDFICEHSTSGRGFGVEVKNTLAYIPQAELRIKLDLCAHLGVHPVFVVRWAPKSYIWDVQKRGGWMLLFEQQQYPFGQEPLMQEVRSVLGFPATTSRSLADDVVRRLQIGVQKLTAGPAPVPPLDSDDQPEPDDDY